MTFARTAGVPPQHDGAGTSTAELQRFANAGRLASAVAHELLSALGVAQTDVGFVCELFDQPERRGDLREAAQEAQAAIARAATRIAAVLSLARARSGEIAPLDVKEVIGAALFDLDARLATRTVAVSLEAVPFALAERGALLQTLVSILLDAADSTPVRACISITLRAESGWVITSVDDAGPSPLAPESLADRAGSPLWICRNVVRSFGGDLVTTQSLLGGKRVTVKLRTDRVSRAAEGS